MKSIILLIQCLFIGISQSVDCPENCSYCDEKGKCQFCKENMYLDDKSGKCLKCYEGCSLCFGPLQNQCKYCSSGLILDKEKNACIQKCPEKKFNQNGQCAYCSELYPVTYIERYNLDNVKKIYSQCKYSPVFQSLCTGGYYYNPQNERCQLCHPKCGQCFGPGISSCLSCKHNHLLYLGKCVGVCPEGYYKQLTKCEKCPDEALSCKSLNNIIKCKQGLILNEEGKCVSGCGQGWYLEQSQQICRRCGLTCNTCIEQGKCIQCEEQYNLQQNGVCQSKCEPGQGFIDKLCKQCNDTNCDVCQKEQECIKCKSGYILYNNKCVQQCPDYTYNNGQGQCLYCGSACKKQCIDNRYQLIDNSQCIYQCPKGQALTLKGVSTRQSECRECAVQNCEQCINEDVYACQVCKKGYVLKEQVPYMWYSSSNRIAHSRPTFGAFAFKSCVQECEPVSFYKKVLNVCYPRNYKTYCSSLSWKFKDQCVLACPQGTFAAQIKSNIDEVVSQECTYQCPPQTFPQQTNTAVNQTHMECIGCSEFCLECNETGCIKCTSGYKIYLDYNINKNLCQL